MCRKQNQQNCENCDLSLKQLGLDMDLLETRKIGNSRRGTWISCLIKLTVLLAWYVYQMVTQNTMHTFEAEQGVQLQTRDCC